MEETTLAQMLAELARLDEQIKRVRARERAEVLDTIKTLMARHHVTLNDIAEASKPAHKRRGVKAPRSQTGKQQPQRDPRQGELL